ncbi:PREDICTED: T-cell leukemia/lymphoma protein 1A [Myotis brandtii]|uniref:T-cell leukemia/lymphoma protein 1A n=1 Tax=Myotis brandtii TaxID=109478 RepID=UPI0007046000|nr:PREDICTED: T-cell leukemia/lymphoma protein 1A [Myotis brandtii]
MGRPGNSRFAGKKWALWPRLGVLPTESSLQVLMRQIEVSRGEAMPPSRLPPSMLPLMWQLYPGRRYRASDSSFWRIVYHIEINGVEDMVLEQLPDP